MTTPDDHAAVPGGISESAVQHRLGGRRTKIAAGVVGLAAVLGAGAYVATGGFPGQHGQVTHVGTRVDQPLPVDPVSGQASPSAGTSRPASSPGASLDPVVAASIKAARAKMAKDGVKVTRPLPTASANGPSDDVQRTTTGSLKAGGIVRVVTAHRDLTGQEELGWVAGGITSHGDAQCTQTFRLFNSPGPAVKPNLLMCWHTSAAKSVVVAVVDPKGNPSQAKALAVLGKKWREMT